MKKILQKVVSWFNFLYGYDIFISYSRSDAGDYAIKLQQQLTSLDFICFLDKQEMPGGQPLTSSLKASLRKSKVLLIIGTEKALSSKYVLLEFNEFSENGRPIIPISVEHATGSGEKLKTVIWTAITERDLVWIDETPEAIANALPSPNVYEGVQNLFHFTRRKVSRRRWTSAAATLIAVASLIAVWQSIELRSQTKTLSKNKIILENANAALNKSNLAIKIQQQNLEKEKNKSLTNAEKARLQELKARQNLARAEEQQLIAEERLKLNRSMSYSTDVGLAYKNYEAGNLLRVTELLGNYDKHGPDMQNPDLRGFEWYYLWKLTHGEILQFKEASKVTSVAYAPDNKKVATGTADGIISVWDIHSGKKLLEFKHGIHGVPDIRVNCLAFSKNSEMLVSASDDETVRIWDLTGNGRHNIIKPPFFHAAESVFFYHDSKYLVLIGRRKDVRIWDIDSGKELGSFSTLVAGSSAISQDKHFLAVGDGAYIQVWDLISQQMLYRIDRMSSSVTALAFSPSQNILAIGYGNNNVELWDLASQKSYFTIRGTGGQSLAYSFDGKMLAIGSYYGEISIWNINKMSPQLAFKGHTGKITSLAFSGNNEKLISGSEDKSAQVWDIGAAQKLNIFTESFPDLRNITLAGNGKMFASLQSHEIYSGKNTIIIKLWNLDDFNLIDSVHCDATEIALSPDGSLLAMIDNNQFKIWDVKARRWRPEITVDDEKMESINEVSCFKFHPTKKLIAVSSLRGLVLLNTVTGKVEVKCQEKNFPPDLFDFSRDGKTITGYAYGLKHPGIMSWDAVTGRLVLENYHVQEGIIESFAVSPDGKMIAYSLQGNTIRLLDLLSEKERILNGYSTWVDYLNFSPDSKTLASLSFDKKIKLWSAESGQEITTLAPPASVITGFSPGKSGDLFAAVDTAGRFILFKAAEKK